MSLISLSANYKKQFLPGVSTQSFCKNAAEEVYMFHKSFPEYRPTPLIELKALSKQLNLKNIFIKDESYRFGLNAFKVLGASFAVAKLLTEKSGSAESTAGHEIFGNRKIQMPTKGITLVTATDGNHGKGVAWTAAKLGCKAVVYMPEGTTSSRYSAIKDLGAEVHIINGTHTDAVNLAAENAVANDWILVQDTAWNNYTEIPMNIMRGYLTIWKEYFEQSNGQLPTHIFIQCGVGSLPAAILAHTVELYGKTKPAFVNVEPMKAACVQKSFSAGRKLKITDKMETIMAGLACDTPSSVAFDILNKYSDFFISCGDDASVEGMKLLGRGKFGDPKIISGESGAVTTGLLYLLLSDPAHRKIADDLGLNDKSIVLLISTEGNTDPVNYLKILDS